MYDRDRKRLDLFGRKASTNLQFGIANYKALMAKYNYTNYSKLSEFIDYLPDDKNQQFKAVISEGYLLAWTALQASLDAAETAARSITMAIVMWRASWLHLSGFLKEVHFTVEGLPFEGPKRFTAKTNESLHTLKDSRVTLQSLGIYTPTQRKKQGKYYSMQWTRPVSYVQPGRQYDSQNCRQRPTRHRPLPFQPLTSQ